MGQNTKYALVSMTNKDTYYVTIEAGKHILSLLSPIPSITFYETTDVKSGATVSIAIQHVSSVVVQEAKRYA